MVLRGDGWKKGQSVSGRDPLYQLTTTACLNAIIVMQIANVWLCRGSMRLMPSIGFGGSPLLIVDAITEIVMWLLINFAHYGYATLRSAEIGINTWFFIIHYRAVILVL
jgi:hypothetical protein